MQGNSASKLATLLLLLGIVCGCRTSHPQHEGYWILSYYPGGRAVSSPAQYAAEYVLISRSPEADLGSGGAPATPEGPGSEVLARELAAGDDVGFLLEDEVLFAVTGPEHTELESGRYCWHLRPGTGPSMTEVRTRAFMKLAVGTVVVVAIIAGGLVSLAPGL